MTCGGNATEACGGPNRLNLFWSGTTGPQTNLGNADWTFSGCYTSVICYELKRTVADQILAKGPQDELCRTVSLQLVAQEH